MGIRSVNKKDNVNTEEVMVYTRGIIVETLSRDAGYWRNVGGGMVDVEGGMVDIGGRMVDIGASFEPTPNTLISICC